MPGRLILSVTLPNIPSEEAVQHYNLIYFCYPEIVLRLLDSLVLYYRSVSGNRVDLATLPPMGPTLSFRTIRSGV